MKKINLIIVIIISWEFTFCFEKCPVPKSCSYADVYPSLCMTCYENYLEKAEPGIECEARRSQFRFELVAHEAYNKSCTDGLNGILINFNFAHRRDSLGKRFDLQAVYRFIFLKRQFYAIRLSNLEGFAIDLGYSIDFLRKGQGDYSLINSRFVFYVSDDSKSRVKSCEDLHGRNISSIMQIPNVVEMIFFKCRFDTPVCPLVFKSARVKEFKITEMTDCFYKKNVLSFSRDEFDNLNSDFERVNLYRVESISLDTQLLSPSVFKTMQYLKIYGSLRTIEERFFEHFPKLGALRLEEIYLRRLLHNGIAWMHSINKNRRFNMSNLTRESLDRRFWLYLEIAKGLTLEHTFPNEDFCLYKDFPHDKLIVFNFEFISVESWQFLVHDAYYPPEPEWLEKRPTCTFHWITKHFEIFTALKYPHYKQLLREAFAKIASECDFEKRLEICNKTHGQVKGPISWNQNDWTIFFTSFQLVLDSTYHLISLCGILTNLVMVCMFVRKENHDIFKGFRHYTFLCAISIFNIVTLVIQILAWMSECTRTLDLFCPTTRKLVLVQFLRLIFKECLIVALRFNFSYVAFAINRIGLIGHDHSKLVEWMTKVEIKKFFIATGFLSSGLSVIKAFKYYVNHKHPQADYPIVRPPTMWPRVSLGNSMFFVINSIVDFLNYFVFVGVNFSIDVYMLVRLRRTLNEKKSKRLVVVAASNENKSDEVMKNALKMVLLNSIMNIVFKLPLLVLPVFNSIAAFYYQGKFRANNPKLEFDRYYRRLLESHFFDFMSKFGEWLVTLYIAFQLFFYIRFDKKINTAFNRLIK